jgi:hypothetical protein
MTQQRWHLLSAGCAIALPIAVLTWLIGGTRAQDPKLASQAATNAAPLTELKVVERVNVATDKGLAYLASKQRPDGGWANNHAINAWTILAFLGRGHVPGRGPYRDVLDKAKKYLISTQRADGFTSFGTMYEHGLATLCLVELYGMDPDPILEEKTRKAVDLILKCQSPQGGWNYGPTPQNGDLSVSVMQIVAMRAANNAEIPVPAEQIERAIKYLKDHELAGGGGFGYGGPGSGPQTSAAGTISMQLMGKFDHPTLPKTLEYLSAIPISWDAAGPQYFFYFHYYAIQAMYQAGGKHWNEWHPRVRELLLDKQNKDGSWDMPPGTAEAAYNQDKVYATAVACLVLDIYQHFLPAYQR